MTGPGMALRGAEGAVELAVRHMEQQNKRALRYFGRGLVMFSLSIAVASLEAIVAKDIVRVIVMGSVGVWSIVMLNYYGARYTRFQRKAFFSSTLAHLHRSKPRHQPFFKSRRPLPASHSIVLRCVLHLARF